jgi:hypothetical protein
LYRLAQCTDDSSVRFLLACQALEVLVAHRRDAILGRLATNVRTEMLKDIDERLAIAKLRGTERERIVSSIRVTEAQSYPTSAHAYLDALSLHTDGSDLGWIQRQRGSFVHTGTLSQSDGALKRRNDFVALVGSALQREMTRAAEAAAEATQ